MCVWKMRVTVWQREAGNHGGTDRDTTACTFVEDEIMMIMIKLMNDEGHSDNMRDETDDNDSAMSASI